MGGGKAGGNPLFCCSGHGPVLTLQTMSFVRLMQSEVNPHEASAQGETRSSSTESRLRWYSGITGYQWLVLAIASLGWIFDVFEGQVFVASMN
jgi:hypothetical protein